MKPKILISQNTTLPNYIEALEENGAIVTAEYLPKYSDEYDGLLLSGGADIHPRYYGQKIDGSVGIDEARDAAEMELLRHFVEAKKPVMGICRGHQLINVFFGGTLIQHIDTADDHRGEGDAVHNVDSVDGAILTSLFGRHFPVNSSHHQAVDRLGDGLHTVQVSSLDGICEGIEHESLPVFAVQWHPERTTLGRARPDTVDGGAIFKYFVELCANNR